MQNLLRILCLFVLLASCGSKTQVDFIILGKVYTVDTAFTVAEAVAIKDGKIVATGTAAALQQAYRATETLDMQGKYVYPGFIDAHAHFYRYGLGLRELDLTGTTSWQEIVQKIKDRIAQQPLQPGEWLIGRGWDQNDWQVKQFPENNLLNELLPDHPVLLTRVDGHAAIANAKALALGGIQADTKITGGDVIAKDGKPTGVLIDNAIDLVSSRIPPPSQQQVAEALLAAQKNCFAAGLTTVDDCGLDYEQVLQIEKLQDEGKLQMRLYVMLSDAPQNYAAIFKRGMIEKPLLHVRSFKVYADGALGSRGACLLHHYSDRPNYYGFLLREQRHFDSVANIIYAKGFQMCTHAIGDSANRTILDIYGKYLPPQNDLRWRIEHAQVVSADDIYKFGKYGIVPSVQPTHATSDMYWAGERLGKQREKTAYAFRQLLEQNGWIPLGTDFPVEDIDPLKTFYAAVFRKDAQGTPPQGYQTENALSRKQALQGMTLWAARANFEERAKGSLEKGKYADLVILDQDLMEVNESQFLQTKVVATISNGKLVYRRP